MKKKEVQNKKMIMPSSGITLMSLIITIVVLLILSGVVISSLSTNNGVIPESEKSVSKLQRSEIIENAKLYIAEEQRKNKGNNITKEQLITILNKYFNTVDKSDIPDNVSSSNDIELTTLDGRNTIMLSEIYKGKFKVVK